MRNEFGKSTGHRPGGDASAVDQVSAIVKKNLRRGAPLFGVVLFGIVAASGIYSVGPGEQGIIRTFGKEGAKTGPGLHFAVPGVQKVDVVNVEKVRRLEIGFRGNKIVHTEAQMLTGDENIVEVQMIVQYRVTDPSKMLFRLEAPTATLRSSAEVALRSVVGKSTIDDVLTTGRERVQAETRKMLQQLIDRYQSGITVTEVKLREVDAPADVREAFHDVARAREEKEKLINQAKGYRADVIPRARGEAQKMEREAEAYKKERVLRARGDVAAFNAVLTEYKKAKGVTRERLHLETLQRVLAAVHHKVVIDGNVADRAIPLMPLTTGVIGASAQSNKKGRK